MEMVLQTADGCRFVCRVKLNSVLAHTGLDRLGAVVETEILAGGEVIIELCVLENQTYVPAHLRLLLNHIKARHERPRRLGG